MSPTPMPRVSRDRTVGISARTSHLLVTSVFVGGSVLNLPPERLSAWRRLTLVTGLALLVTEARHSRDWPYQGRGLTTYAHVAVLSAGVLGPRAAKVAAVSALLIGSVGSHLPKAVRTWVPSRPGVVEGAPGR